ncbi:hypothetical protein [Coraliomargarita akajimensis]|uniref:Uncharacterized protein n=1 Tax=Coraliomargarita akajimensis (strain DSM 45221 / IAM 15411 / JCM 23193 / KCTC 12865 / 04OKA010-24) TaxID=583355 RepID=D5ENV4_CORAD|nr:hypothetical protein [Coraliomargarita akajimensis]ADE53613.1 conserved hypothetical protein [Coraliomargarita akajimensis DSM 45221]
MNSLKYPDHPVLEAPWVYQIVDFHYFCPINSPKDHFIEIGLQKENETVVLHFIRPSGVKIGENFPTQLGLFISDVSQNQWEGIKIEVGDFENSSIHFYARGVKRSEPGSRGNG